ncbi:MAG: OmpA family protein [Bacteroidales bacterium]
MNRTILYLFFALTMFAVSCVPARKYQDLEANYQEYSRENTLLRKENEAASSMNNELAERIERLERQVSLLKQDTTRLNSNIRDLTRNYEQLNRTYELVQEQNERLLAGRSEETQMILKRLQATQEDLQVREDELREATIALNEKEENLKQKEMRVNELEEILARQDAAVKALRSTVSDALLGFENNGLTVEIKQGKVYVSLEESLLFASGSTNVDARGETALKELAGVLESNPGIHVLIEGHTDDVPLRPGAQIRDNWDLSVLRATAIVRILLKHAELDPQRLTAAGKGEHMPLDPANTAEARRKNRRTEIILTPRLDDLFQILEMN